jgi:hypothetical protein
MSNNQVVFHLNNAMFALANARRMCEQGTANRIEDLVNEVQSLSTEVYNGPTMAGQFLDPPDTFHPEMDGDDPDGGVSIGTLGDIPDHIKMRSQSPLPRPPTDIAFKMTEKLFFLDKIEYENGCKHKSIEPAEIVGANMLFVFNTVNRQLAYYEANDEDGFTVRGSTLHHFNPETSMGKTLRWPEKQLDQVFDTHDPVRWYSYIKSVPKSLTGRINKHCILLRAI